jgi:hypothetical protein
MKKCNNCNIELENEHFHKRKSSKDGLFNICKNCEKERKRKYYIINQKNILNNASVYRVNNKEKISEINKKYNEKNKEKINKRNRENPNKNKKTKYKTEYIKKRKQYDNLFRFKDSVKKLIRESFRRKNTDKVIASSVILGCSFEEFKLHLESKFEPWMNWDNYGKYNGMPNFGWDIDHIIPNSLATTREDVIRLNHYTNLQPLCSYINRNVKRDSI